MSIKHRYHFSYASVFAVLLVLFSAGITTGQESSKPNIIWLMAEDIGPDIECYGMQAVKTPVLNQLAESGIQFNNAYCTNSICSPSRSAMMTGVHQNKINAHQHRSNRNIPLDPKVQPFTCYLRNAGYTCILGHHGVMGKGRKTDVNFKHEKIGAWDGVEQFGLFDKYDNFSKEDQPFFAQIQLNVTHRGGWWDQIRERSTHKVDPAEVVLPPFMADHPTIRLDWAKYLDQIEYMDNEVGMIVQELKDKGMYENTVIIFIGDNGRCNIRGKGYLFDPGLHIPLIVSWPNGIEANQLRDELVSTTDITATILDLAGAKMPDYLTGSSFMQKDFNREVAYSSRDLWDEIMEQSRSLYDGRFKYIRNDKPWLPYDAHQAYLEFYRPAVHVMRKLNLEEKLTADQKVFFDYYKPAEQLFDLQNDPYELNNLAGNPEYQEMLNQFRTRLSEVEHDMTPEQDSFEPIVPKAVEVLNYVRYFHPEAYQQMLNGKEIGFGKYNTLYEKHKANE